ncbi:MAG: cupin domain-containing protein [Firmicutes bacterium]|nr:cupin domain-containing protein [Bacillota bacterium]
MEETHDVVFENESVRVEIIKSFGVESGADEWYDQEESEIAFVTKGGAVIDFGDRKLTLNAGDYYHFRAHERHRVDFTSDDCEWLCLYISAQRIARSAR